MVSVDGSLGNLSCETRHSSSYCCNDNGISDKVIFIPDTVPLAIVEVFILVMMVEVYLGYKIPATLSLAIMEFIILFLMVDVQLGLHIPSTIPLKIL